MSVIATFVPKVAKSVGKRSVRAILRSKNTSRSCECSGAIRRTVGLPTPYYSGHLHVVSNKLLSTTNRQFASPNAEYVHNHLKHTALLHAIPRAPRISVIQTYGKYIFVMRRGAAPSPFHYSHAGMITSGYIFLRRWPAVSSSVVGILPSLGYALVTGTSQVRSPSWLARVERYASSS